MRGHDEYAIQVGTLGLRTEQYVVEDSLIQRHGDVVLGLEGYGALEILFFHAREVEQPHDHPAVRDAEDNRLPLERVRGPELPDLRTEDLYIGDLAVDYRAGGQPVVPDVPQRELTSAPRDLDRLEGAAVYVQPDGPGASSS